MAHAIQTDLTWLDEHGVNDPKTGWTCKKTGADINAVRTGRSIHYFGISAGGGEVRQVLHLYCTGCNPNFEPPPYGTPIQESALVEVAD